jgi:hypothetical protein
MRAWPRLLSLLIGLTLAGCVDGLKKETWSKAELVDWYVRFGADKPKIGYSGSDADYHYFKSRPIDSWVSLRVARSEIIISDERSHASLGHRFWFYTVDPTHAFAKIPNSDAPQ